MLYILVCGSRNFCDNALLTTTLDEVLFDNTESVCIVSGHAAGADTLGERYADEHHLEKAIFPAKWDLYGKQAGLIRDKEMVDFIQSKENKMVIAFPVGESRGTRYTISLARKANIKTIVREGE